MVETIYSKLTEYNLITIMITQPQNKKKSISICFHCDQTEPLEFPVRDKADQIMQQIRNENELN